MEEEIITSAKHFIKIPYIDGQGEFDKATQLLELVKQQLPEYSYTSYIANNVPSLLYTNQEKENRHFTIILNAHLDVVSAKDKEYLPYIDDGKLYGRGAKDMKAAAAVMILLFKDLGKIVPYPLGLQIVTDEE